jgi:hypothetical protein
MQLGSIQPFHITHSQYKLCSAYLISAVVGRLTHAHGSLYSRWLAPLLAQTLPLSSLFPIWDVLFSRPMRTRDINPKLEYLVDICTALLVRACAPLVRYVSGDFQATLSDVLFIHLFRAGWGSQRGMYRVFGHKNTQYFDLLRLFVHGNSVMRSRRALRFSHPTRSMQRAE